MTRKRIAIVTTKQPGTNPRMRKNADALSAAGYDVRVLYAYNAKWADIADQSTFKSANWTHRRMGGHPTAAPLHYFVTRIKRRWAKKKNDLAHQLCPFADEYVKDLVAFQPDLVIGHNPGTLPILTRAQNELKLNVLFDAEDFHRGEFPEGSEEVARFTQLENQHLSDLNWMTAASPLIQNAYQKLYPNIRCETINNTFDLTLQPNFKSLSGSSLKLCWFSQVVGLNRGLQEFLSHLSALGDLSLTISIIGNTTEDVRSSLFSFIKHPTHSLQFLPATIESQLADIVSDHHIGLALEPGFSSNNLIARSNKIFFYPLCGCLTLFSKTPSQLQFQQEYQNTGHVIDLTDPTLSVEILRWLAAHPTELEFKRQEAWTLARESLNWETESKKLVSLVATLIQDAS